MPRRRNRCPSCGKRHSRGKGRVCFGCLREDYNWPDKEKRERLMRRSARVRWICSVVDRKMLSHGYLKFPVFDPDLREWLPAEQPPPFCPGGKR